MIERYFGDERAATDADGWFDTGDLARIDQDGNLIITGRAKDLIKSGGEWINPAEIEAIIGRLPQVSLAAVIGRCDPQWGERPVLLVECTDLRRARCAGRQHSGMGRRVDGQALRSGRAASDRPVEARPAGSTSCPAANAPTGSDVCKAPDAGRR